MATTFQRDIRGGRVFTKIVVNDGDVRDLSRSLRYASTQGAVSTFLQVKEVAEDALSFLRSRFPESKTVPGGLYPTFTNGRLNKAKAYIEQKRSMELNKGWKVSLTENAVTSRAASLLGFRIYHSKEARQRVRTILASLNYGSKGFTVYPKRVKWLKAFFGGADGSIFFWNKYIKVPSKSGLFYIEETEKYIERKYAAKSDEIQDAIAALIEKGIRPSKRLYSVAPFQRAPKSGLSRIRRASFLSSGQNLFANVARQASEIRRGGRN